MEKGFTKLFWQACLVGLLTGLIVVLFRLGIENLFGFVMTNFYSHPLIFLFVTTLGGLIAGIFVYKFAPETSGSGIPYVKMSSIFTCRLACAGMDRATVALPGSVEICVYVSLP